LTITFHLGIALALYHLILSGKASVGTIVLAQLYLVKLAQSLWDLNRTTEKVEESLANAAEMTEIIIQQPEVNDVPTPLPFVVKKGEIEFQDVSFTYADIQAGESLFTSVNMLIQPGQRVGLVGPSGGGKSTITRLILRFMDIQAGQILIDGQNISQVAQSDLRAAIAYVPQEPILFHRSIRENIAYGNPQATAEEIKKVARLAHADEFIDKLPAGYDTLVGERGVKLSGGEKQRIAIARAMLKKAPIVILDEATSALDSKSEKAIVGALDNLMANRTTIVIAHRLSTIRKLDRIIVLQDGQIAEDDSHTALLKAKGLYAEFWKHQSGEFIGET
jgi:ATP-binding cassette subfamily B protein